MNQALTRSLTASVWAANIAPPSRKMVALLMAELHDSNNGLIEVSMRMLATQAGISANQARTHVHALVADGVLAVTANSHGGAPSQLPRYRFFCDRLAVLGSAV